jgi:4'-phosphopantetheinyl transferase
MESATKVEIREFGAGLPIPPDLSPNVAHVWTLRLESIDGLQAAQEILAEDERERAARFRADEARKDFILTRAALRSLCAGYLAVTPQALQFVVSEYGKPTLSAEHNLQFNVSHTQGLALLAFVRDREIGVDVEKIGPAPDARKLAERFFSQVERAALEPLSGGELQAAFFRCWTRKEAYIKARGAGLSLPLDQFDVSLAADAADALLATRPDPLDVQRWSVRNLPIHAGYAAALALAENVNK